MNKARTPQTWRGSPHPRKVHSLPSGGGTCESAHRSPGPALFRGLPDLVGHNGTGLVQASVAEVGVALHKEVRVPWAQEARERPLHKEVRVPWAQRNGR